MYVLVSPAVGPAPGIGRIFRYYVTIREETERPQEDTVSPMSARNRGARAKAEKREGGANVS